MKSFQQDHQRKRPTQNEDGGSISALADEYKYLKEEIRNLKNKNNYLSEELAKFDNQHFATSGLSSDENFVEKKRRFVEGYQQVTESGTNIFPFE